MDPKHIYADERMRGYCVYCGGPPETSDHSPSKVFLDKPYPQNLGEVNACHKCNQGFSLDEQYLACFLECTICGSTKPEELERVSIVKILKETPALVARIRESVTKEGDQLIWVPETNRVARIIEKLAISHVDYELSIQPSGDPEIKYEPLHLLSPENQEGFFQESVVGTWPEIGSRAYNNVLKAPEQTGFESWRCVQQGRYSYFISQDAGLCVRILLRDYLACEIHWEA